MPVRLLNNIRSQLAANLPAAGTGSTTVRVLTGHGSRFPVLTTDDDWFPLAIENANGQIEFCRATARNGDLITVVRAQEGSSARDYSAGDAVEVRLTVAALAEIGSGSGISMPVVNVADGTVEGQ